MLTAKHVVQTNFGSEREFLVSNFVVDNRSFTLIDTTNDRTYATPNGKISWKIS